MSEFLFTWDCSTWLENNFFINNGVPEFFLAGKYSYQSKTTAVNEYEKCVEKAVHSNNLSFKTWATMIIDNEFSILNNQDVQAFWDGMLVDQTREKRILQYSALRFINESSESIESGDKRKRASTVVSPVVYFNREHFRENDEVYIDGIEGSLGTSIVVNAMEIQVTDRQSKYYNALGRNNILDLSDDSEASQMAHYSREAQAQIKLKFPPPDVVLDNSTSTEFEQLQDNLNRLASEKSYLKKYLNKIYKTNIYDKHSIIRDTYVHFINLHLYHDYLFQETEEPYISETDYEVKVWGPLLETIFRSSDIILHWGDTIPPNCKALGQNPRMDVRFISRTLTRQESCADIGNGEAAREPGNQKYFKDKLKMVLTNKVSLNGRLDNLSKEVSNIYMPFLIIMGLEAILYTLRLSANGLYVINEISDISIPKNIDEIQNGNISDCVRGLLKIKKIATSIKDIDVKIQRLKESKRRKRIKNITNTQADTIDNGNDIYREWIRPVWFPEKVDDVEL